MSHREEDSELSQVETLTGKSSFPTWKFDIGILLKAAGLFDIVTGKTTIKTEDSADVKELWTKRDARAQKMIVLTVDRANKIHLMTCGSAAEMYKKLCTLYEQSTAEQKSDLMQDFYKFEFDSSLNLASNISALQNLVTTINSFDAANKKIDDEMLMGRILSLLPPEYISAAECAATLTYLKSFLEELSGRNVNVILFIDNKSTINLAENGILNRRSKHIDVKYHFLKEKVDENVIKLEYVPTEKNIADIFTKALVPVKFEHFKAQLIS